MRPPGKAGCGPRGVNCGRKLPTGLRLAAGRALQDGDRAAIAETQTTQTLATCARPRLVRTDSRKETSMNPAYKHLVAATALAFLGLTAGAQAPQPAVVAPHPAPAMQDQHPMMQHRLERQQQRAAQRQERLKQILQITPAQEGAWSTWIASRQTGTSFRGGQRAEFAQLTTPERIDRMRALRAARAAEAERRGEATKAFYAALTPAQQKAFDALQAESGFKRGGGHLHGHHDG